MLPTNASKKILSALSCLMDAPSLPGDQPGGEQVGSQCRTNHYERALPQFHRAFVLNTFVGRAKEGCQAKTKVTPGGSYQQLLVSAG
jgi:hypothetical protein